MTQIPVAYDRDMFMPRADMRELFHGIVGGVPSRICKDDEKPRRADGLKPHYGEGTPSVNSAEIDIWGLVKNAEASNYQVVDTTEGSMKIPVEREHLQFLPSTDTLQQVTHSLGTRLAHTPARYYSR